MDTNQVLLRIIYVSRALAGPDDATPPVDLRAILLHARVHNAANDISGLLMVSNGTYLQVLEGDAEIVNALYARIAADTRHSDVKLLSSAVISERSFGSWSMGLVERSEPEATTEARQKFLLDRLSVDSEASAADICQLILAPDVNPGPFPRLLLRPRSRSISSVAFASALGLWGSAVLQHVSSKATQRTGRTCVIDPENAAQRTMIEYVDVDLPDLGPVRVLSLATGPETIAPIAPLMEGLTLLVFTMALSDVESFVAYVGTWLALPQVATAAPRILVLASLPPDIVLPMLEALRAATELRIDFVRVKLSDSAAVWQAAQWPLRGQIAVRRAAAGSAQLPVIAERADASSATTMTVPAAAAPLESKRDQERGVILSGPPVSVNANDAARSMVDAGCLHELFDLDGAIAVSLIDAESGATLHTLSATDVDMQQSFDADAVFLRGKWRLWKSLRLEDAVEDIVITTGSTLQVFRSLGASPTLFVAVLFDRKRVQLGMARLRVQETVDALAQLQ